MGENNQHNTLAIFDENKNVAISSELYDMGHYRWKMSTMGYRTLFAVAQGMERDTGLTSIHIKKDAMFEYLGLDTTNRKYEMLADALREVRQTGLDFCTVSKNGKRTWEGHSWITDYVLSEEDNFVHIEVNKKAMQFLIRLKQFALIQPKHYLQLSTDYQNWFYPFLKLRLGSPEGRWEVSIDEISDALKLETNYVKRERMEGGRKITELQAQASKAYARDNKDRVGNILKRVIGITPSEAYKEELKKAKEEGREARFRAWDYVKDNNGNPSGTLYTISQNTDIEVTAMPVKIGRSYGKVIFYIKEKIEAMSKKRLEQLHEGIVNAAEMDMGGRKSGGESIVPSKPVAYHTDEELRDFGRRIGMESVEEVARMYGFVKDKNGMWRK